MDTISWIFLIVSIVSLAVQLVGLSRMSLKEKNVSPLVRRAMIRTAACRVLAAIAYIILSAYTLVFEDTFHIFSATVFISVQVMWWMNAVSDVLLRRRLENKSRHRKRGIMGSWLRTYAKAFAQLGGAVLVAILPLISNGAVLTSSEWVNVSIVGVGAASVWNTTNHPEWPYGKLIGSAIVTALTTLNSYLSSGLTQVEITQIILALVTTVMVGLVSNTPSSPKIPVSNMNPEGLTTT